MAQSLRDLDPTFVLIVLVPLAAATAAWALRVACSVCSVESPDFWHSVLAVVIICVANIVLRFWLKVSHVPTGIGPQVVAPLVTTALVIAMSVRTGPLSACKVTFVHGMLCGLIYCMVTAMGKVLIAGMIM